MKNIKSTYTFVAASKTIQCDDFALIGFAKILFIVNVTRGLVIYNPSNTATNGAFTGSTLTLTYDTTSHANSDVLQIFTDDGDTGSTEQTLGTLCLLFSEFMERFEVFCQNGAMFVSVQGTPTTTVSSGTVTANPPNTASVSHLSPPMSDHYRQIIAENAQIQLYLPG